MKQLLFGILTLIAGTFGVSWVLFDDPLGDKWYGLAVYHLCGLVVVAGIIACMEGGSVVIDEKSRGREVK